MRFTQIMSVAAMAMTAVSAIAQIQITQDGRPERIFRPVAGLDNADIAFMKGASITNIFEMKVSELARSKSQDPFVLEYAKEMIDDHQESYNELKDIADKKGVSLPQDFPAPLKHTFDHLANLSGAAFDNEFQRVQKYGHEDASRLFKAEIENGRDEDVKGYAVKALPTVTMHYKMMLTHTTMMGPNKMQGGG